jgi:hypothetical protein
MAKKYIVVKPFGNHREGDILEESRTVRRKIQEGGTVEELTDELLKKKKAEKVKKNADLKKMQKPVKNKMEPDNAKNKGDK